MKREDKANSYISQDLLCENECNGGIGVRTHLSPSYSLSLPPLSHLGFSLDIFYWIWKRIKKYLLESFFITNY